MRAGPRGHRRPQSRDHRPGRSEDGHQRAQFGRERVHGGLRGREHAEVGQQRAGPHQSARCDSPPDRLHVPRRQRLHAESEDRGAVRAPARLAPARKARADRREADLRRALRFRAVLLSQREGAPRARQRSVFLPAEAREPPGSAAVERRLRDGAGRAWRAARLDPRDGPRRDAACRVRDGRDPPRAARAFGGAQLRSLGLHLLVHQETAEPPRFLSRRSRARHDDDALHEELRAATRSRPATGATSTRWAGWRHRFP